MRALRRRRPLLLILTALTTLGSAAAHAAPSGAALRVTDPRGDSRSADPGHDLTALTVRSGSDSFGRRTLFLRLDLVGPVRDENTMYEVTFRTPTCAIRLAHFGASAQEAASLTPARMTFDCGPTGSVYLGAEATSPATLKAEGRSITWSVAPRRGVLETGMQLSDIRAFASVSDPVRQLWAANTAGLHAHDELTSPVTYRHR